MYVDKLAAQFTLYIKNYIKTKYNLCQKQRYQKSNARNSLYLQFWGLRVTVGTSVRALPHKVRCVTNSGTKRIASFRRRYDYQNIASTRINQKFPAYFQFQKVQISFQKTAKLSLRGDKLYVIQCDFSVYLEVHRFFLVKNDLEVSSKTTT